MLQGSRIHDDVTLVSSCPMMCCQVNEMMLQTTIGYVFQPAFYVPFL